MNKKLPIADCRLPIERRNEIVLSDSIANRQSPVVNGFTLIEIMVVVVLLSLIVLALMAVFNSTQKAFRASVTQTDVLEGGRAAMDLMAQDVREMSPSFDNNAVNFYAAVTNYSSPPSPLVQALTASASLRTNVLENFFILSRGNQNGVPTWYGTGYAVSVSPNNLYSLYRFETNHPVTASGALSNLCYTDFRNFLLAPDNYSHLMDGVVHLTVRAYDMNGVWMTNGYINLTNLTVKNVVFLKSTNSEVGFYMFSNTLPASVEINMGVLEDQALRRTESLGGSASAQTAYLTNSAGAVHIFRERISIPNVDPSAYQ